MKIDAYTRPIGGPRVTTVSASSAVPTTILTGTPTTNTFIWGSTRETTASPVSAAAGTASPE
jgi:hypothetical protein